MIEFSPRFDYQKFQKPTLEKFQEIAEQPWFRLSLDMALAQTAAQGASREELGGMRRFISNLISLPVVEEKITNYPPANLPSYEDYNPPKPS